MALSATPKLTEINTEIGTTGQSEVTCIDNVGKTGVWDRQTDFANYSNEIIVTPATKNVDYLGETFDIDIDVTTNWQADSGDFPSWISLNSYANAGSSTVQCTVENNVGVARNYTIIFYNTETNDTCAVDQDAAP